MLLGEISSRWLGRALGFRLYALVERRGPNSDGLEWPNVIETDQSRVMIGR